MFICYESDSEILVTTRRKEVRAIKEWFGDTGRDIEDYGRTEVKDSGVLIKAGVKID